MAGDLVHDPDLLDALEQLPTKKFSDVVWRVSWASRDPLAGGTGGGRWHPPGNAEILYTSLTEDGALAEVYHHLSKAPVFTSSNMKIAQIELNADRAIELSDLAALEILGVSADSFKKGDYSRTGEIGAAARFLDVDTLIVPSARSSSLNLVVFLDRLENLEHLKLIKQSEINWPAYRENTKNRK